MQDTIAERGLYHSFKLQPIQTNDPFSLFPVEIVDLCLSTFGRKRVVQLSEVNKTWYLTTSQSCTWGKFILRSFGTTHPRYEKCLDKFFYISLEKIHRAQTQTFQNRMRTALFDSDVKKCAQANSLCRSLNLSYTDRIWTNRGLSCLSENLTHLTSICIHEKLDIPYGQKNPFVKITESGIKQIASACPMLKHLDLEIRSFSINSGWSHAVQIFVERCPKLKNIRIANDLMNDSDIRSLIKHCKCLKSLEISGTSSITNTWTAEIKQISTLKKLILKKTKAHQIPIIIQVVEKLPILQVFVLKSCELVQSNHAISVLKLPYSCQNLKKMILCSNFKLRNKKVSDIVNRIKQIGKVNIEFQ